ncbi:MAG TPA: hypothetical protein PLO37_01465 [Candidatus Hydrogenedentes bacterium]|nr:hypothetical protein [Candidatus Hydrogenedentota bacterium]HPG65485.1 hypothetical protein [Candidatus Hydrogenedentota bacterium]
MGTSRTLDRRGFLSRAGVCATGLMAVAGASPHTENVRSTSALPTVNLGEHAVTRLIVGGNPIGGYSHATWNLSRHMSDYFTVDRTVEFLGHCEAQGINTFQSDPNDKVRQVLDVVHTGDSKLNYICLYSEQSSGPSWDEVMRCKPIAVVHHGGVTDSLFRAGKAGEVHDFVKKAHDHGVLAGVSAHNPEVIARIADEDWENDLFMTCMYRVTRTRDEMEQEFGFATVDEPFIVSDPDKMTAVVRQVDKPCLVFKILAAGRRGNSDGEVGQAFQYAFANIKRTDAVIVGMFPLYQDEVALNVAHTKKYGQIG